LNKLKRWSDAEKDCGRALEFNPQNMKALYRRADARMNLGDNLDGAREDIQCVLNSSGESSNPDAERMKAEILQKIKAKVAQKKEAALTAKTAPGARVAKAAVPSTRPKNAYELQRHMNSLKRHPAVVAEYIKTQVPPSTIPGLFKKSSVETDILGLLVSTVKNNLHDGACFGPEIALDYVQALLKTHLADMQFGMLSSAEIKDLREILASAPASDSKAAVSEKLKGVL